MTGRICSVVGCGERHRARGWCRTHYRRWQRHGSPLAERPVRRPEASYWTARQRLYAVRGPATDHACAECGAPAACWSYDGADPDERVDACGHRYSLDVVRYRPRCRSCHRRGRRVERFDIERAARLYRNGATARAIGRLFDIGPDAVLTRLRSHGVQIRSSRSTSRSTLRTRAQPEAESTPVHPDPMECAASPDGPAAKIDKTAWGRPC